MYVNRYVRACVRAITMGPYFTFLILICTCVYPTESWDIQMIHEAPITLSDLQHHHPHAHHKLMKGVKMKDVCKRLAVISCPGWQCGGDLVPLERKEEMDVTACLQCSNGACGNYTNQFIGYHLKSCVCVEKGVIRRKEEENEVILPVTCPINAKQMNTNKRKSTRRVCNDDRQDKIIIQIKDDLDDLVVLICRERKCNEAYYNTRVGQTMRFKRLGYGIKLHWMDERCRCMEDDHKNARPLSEFAQFSFNLTDCNDRKRVVTLGNITKELHKARRKCKKDTTPPPPPLPPPTTTTEVTTTEENGSQVTTSIPQNNGPYGNFLNLLNITPPPSPSPSPFPASLALTPTIIIIIIIIIAVIVIKRRRREIARNSDT